MQLSSIDAEKIFMTQKMLKVIVFISRDTLLDCLLKNSKQTIHYRHKTNNISVKIINIVYCKTRREITPVFVCDI